MLISEVFWLKRENKWEFHCNYDDNEREWDRKDTGFLVIANDSRIQAYCLRGHEEEWKLRVIVEYIRKCDEKIKKNSTNKRHAEQSFNHFQRGLHSGLFLM